MHVVDTRGQPDTRLWGTPLLVRCCSPLHVCTVSKTQQFCGSRLFSFSLSSAGVREQGSLRSTSQKVCFSWLTSEGLLITGKRHQLQTRCVQGHESHLPSRVVFQCCPRTAVWERNPRAPPAQERVDCSVENFSLIQPMTLSSISEEGNS